MSSKQQLNPADYRQGEDRYIRFCQDFLDLELAEAQKKILRSVANNQRTMVWGGNGPGKSYTVAALKLAFLFTNPPSIVLGTSGSYEQYEDTMWRPLEDMFDQAREKYGLPGETKGGNRPSLEIESEWYAKIISARDPGELEGRHNDDVMIVIDEADKKFVTEDHFDSAGSSLTDLNDKMVVICNPPKDETNVVYRKRQSDRWNEVHLSAFDSRNARIDAGEINKDRIPGLVDLITIASDYEEWNQRDWPLAEQNYPGEEWPGMATIENKLDNDQHPLTRDDVLPWIAPGYSVAKEAHKRYDTLDERWYRRRAGVMPPSAAEAHRPIEPEDVDDAWDRSIPADVRETPRTVGIDVARSEDRTVMIGEHKNELRVHYSEQGDNHETQKREVVEGTATTPGLNDWPAPAVAVDKGYAPGFYDYVSDQVPNVVGFQNGTKPVEGNRWYNKWAEALYHFGQWLEDGGVIHNADLRKEAKVASRVVEFSERTLNSRGENGAEVYEATSKDKIKEELSGSPDLLDAALMAVWRLRADQGTGEVNSTWYDPYAQV